MSPPILVVACVSLLAVQLSGVHMHVDADGYAGIPQGTHVHSQILRGHSGAAHADPASAHGHSHGGDHPHDGDKDVAIVELSTASSKAVIVPVWMGLSLLVALPPGEKLSPHATVPRSVDRHARWRPPQRAPPRLA